MNKIPSAIPESEWAGLASVNYTGKHEELSELIRCLHVPMGVLGYYLWQSTALSFIFSIMACCNHKFTNKDSVINFLTATLCIVQLYQHSKMLAACDLSTSSHRAMVFSATTPSIIATSFALLGYLALGFASETSAGTSFTLFCIALTVQLIGPCYFDGHLRNVLLEGGSGTLFDRVRLWSTMAATFPIMLIAALLFIGLVAAPGIWLLIPAASILILLCSVSVNVAMGKVIGDPWGLYTTRRWEGIVDAMLTGVVPVVQLGLILLHPKMAGSDGNRRYNEDDGEREYPESSRFY